MNDHHGLVPGHGVARVLLEDRERSLVRLPFNVVGVEPVEDDRRVGERVVVRVAEGQAHRRVPGAPRDEEEPSDARRP